jgi:phenylacetate-coenzyme A ligase PaaK-like adenylate-forming protein
LIARTGWGREQVRAHQARRLGALLRHAADHSPFHADRLAGVDLDAVTPDDLSAVPVMTKSDLMEHFDDVVTDRRITRERAEQALAGARDQAALVDDALVLTSGGSSGPRGVFVLEPSACCQFFGSLSRGLMARLRETGTPPGGLRMAMVAAAAPVHATGAASWLTDEAPLPFYFVAVPVTLPLDEIVGRLNAVAPMVLYGYPSMLARLGAEQEAGRLRIEPGTVTCTGETLTAEARATIGAAFGAPVIDSFGSSEGLVGGSAPDDDIMIFAEDGCIVELVDADDRPVPPGTPSAAVLITVLENRLQPLLRYRLVDSFVAEPPAHGHGYLRARVEGRADEILRFGRLTLHPLVIRSVLAHRPEVTDYRVRQTPHGIAVSVLAPRGADTAALCARLASSLATAGLRDPDVQVDVVTELPRDPRSGKLRRVVPLT